MNAPDHVQALAAARADARSAKDFARADAMRAEIDAAGWTVVDKAGRFELVEKPPFDVLRDVDALVSSAPVEAPTVVCVIVDGWPDDTDVCLQALKAHAPAEAMVLVIDCANVDEAGARAEVFADDQPERFRVLHMEGTLASLGWSSVVSAAIDLSRCDVFVIMDLSTIIEGDAFAPMREVLDRDDVVGTGWKGVNVNVDDGWRSFDAAEAGEADAILGYLMVLKREAIEVVRPDPKARFYRNADMEWSLALREAGGILAIPADSLPIRQGRHHGYHDSDPAFREKQSKKTYDRLLQRFRGKDHLLAPR
ncbi:MAG: hypothetical protein GY871_02690 [Actinomycetales bacterium]|nr:hypothetical protein [Actinomycetales bacterium]